METRTEKWLQFVCKMKVCRKQPRMHFLHAGRRGCRDVPARARTGRSTFSVPLLQTMSTRDVPFATMALAHYVAMAHLFGGFLLAFGLITRVAALVQVPVLFGAVFFIHLKEGLFTPGQTLEFSALVLFILVLFSICGSGRLSADYYVFREEGGPDAVSASG
jgi:uncharacterized membrane protein YphA (DoxX/SURF4 family)